MQHKACAAGLGPPLTLLPCCTSAQVACRTAQCSMLVGLVSLSERLPAAEAANVEAWKACLYKRLSGARAFDRPVPLLLVSTTWQHQCLHCLKTPWCRKLYNDSPHVLLVINCQCQFTVRTRINSHDHF